MKPHDEIGSVTHVYFVENRRVKYIYCEHGIKKDQQPADLLSSSGSRT